MISSAFALKEANTTPEYLIPTMETTLEHNYYFNNSLKFLLESQEELLKCRKDFYRNILECDNPYMINESFNDILLNIKQIIKRILSYIDALVRKFITEIPKLVKSDKYIIKMRKEIEKFPKGESFTITGFKFTIDEKIPVVDIIGLDLGELKTLVSGINKNNIDDKCKNIKSVINKLSDFEKMDSIRGQIIDQHREIPESSFHNELFALFRDGKSSPEDIIIDREEVLRANKDFTGYDSQLKSVRRLQKEIDSKYRTLEKQVEDIVKSNITPDGVSKIDIDCSDLSTVINTLLTKQIEQIRRISNVHVLAIASKLDAYNDLVLQDRNILYRALNVVQNNNISMKEASIDYDYTMEGNYRGYVIEKYFMNENHKYFVEECLALSESNIPELKAIHEDLKMNRQNWFRKLKELVKSLFEKFMMKMNKLMVGNNEFLTKYKDVILTKKIEEYTLNDMPDYKSGIENIKSYQFKNANLKELVSKEDRDIQSYVLNEYDGNTEFVEFANRYFLCDNDKKFKPRDIKSSELNMAEIYAFCVSAKEAIKNIESGFSKFYNENDKVMNEVINNIKANSVKETMDLTGKKYYYSNVLETFVNEEDGATGDAKTSGGEKPPAFDPTVNKPNNEPSDNKDLVDKTKTKEDDNLKDSKTQTDENKGADYTKLENAGKTYLNAIKAVNLAKITAFQKIYNEYMKILRYHVSKATGSMGSASKFTEEDIKELKATMKQYRDSKGSDKDAARDKIISIYKSRQMVIDARDVQDLVNKNAKAL